MICLQMPRMHGAAVQCCMCIVGVFLFLGGLIMLVTGITLILNYGLFDENLLPPDLQNDEGKKTVGIILTSCGLFAILISVVASLLYLCTRSKPSTINPRELSRMQSSARGTPPDRTDHRRTDRRPGPVKPLANGNIRPANTKSIPGSTEVIHSRQPGHRKRTRKMKHRGRRLEEIKEQDAISRKTVEGGILADQYEDNNLTPRSGSFSSQFTLDESRNPRVVVATEESGRPPSTDSASTSHTSDISYFRTVESDKSKRELQFLPDSKRFDTVSKDSISLSKDSESIANRRDSGGGSIVSDRYFDKHQMSTSSFNSFNDKNSAGGTDFSAQGRLPDVSSSDESSALSYNMSSYTAIQENRNSVYPQVGETRTTTDVDNKEYFSGVNTNEETKGKETADGGAISSETQDKSPTDSFA